MRIVFMGTSPFAVPSLAKLINSSSHKVELVVTQPDRPHGRGGKMSSTPVKDYAVTHGLPIQQPEKVRAKEFVAMIRELNPDVLVVAAFGQLIPQRLLDIPHYGGINVHGSLLPRWRGAAPMQYALMAGDSETGVTTMQMDAGLDTGDILLQRSMRLEPDDNLATIETKLSEIGADLLLETLEKLEAGVCPRIPQDPALVTQSPSLPPDIGLIQWDKSAAQIHNLVRGVTPKPGAYTFWEGKRIKILNVEPVESDIIAPGVVQTVDSQGITIGTGSGALRLLELQPESKPKMAAAAWARGARITTGVSIG